MRCLRDLLDDGIIAEHESTYEFFPCPQVVLA